MSQDELVLSFTDPRYALRLARQLIVDRDGTGANPMTDPKQLREAAQRALKLCIESPPHVAAREQCRLLGTLAAAYLSEHPVDDGEPVTEEFLRGLGFSENEDAAFERKLENPAILLEAILFDDGRCRLWIAGEVFDAGPQTRGQLRRLLDALGVKPE